MGKFDADDNYFGMLINYTYGLVSVANEDVVWHFVFFSNESVTKFHAQYFRIKMFQL